MANWFPDNLVCHENRLSHNTRKSFFSSKRKDIKIFIIIFKKVIFNFLWCITAYGNWSHIHEPIPPFLLSFHPFSFLSFELKKHIRRYKRGKRKKHFDCGWFYSAFSIFGGSAFPSTVGCFRYFSNFNLISSNS